MLVKRLVCIEDLGDVDVLVHRQDRHPDRGPDHVHRRAGRRRRSAADAVLRWGCSATEATWRDGRAVGGNPLDQRAVAAPPRRSRPARRRTARLAAAALRPRAPDGLGPRRRTDGGRLLITKGAPGVGAGPLHRRPRRRAGRCSTASSPPAAGSSPWPRRAAADSTHLDADDERDLQLAGLPGLPRPAQGRRRRRAAAAGRARRHGQGRHRRQRRWSPQKVCRDLGLAASGTLTGADIDALDDDALAAALPRHDGLRPGQPGAEGRHRPRCSAAAAAPSASSATASTTRSPCTPPTSASRSTPATDVAKDAADVILLEKDLDVLADGVAEGRRIFANTIKYVLMGTSQQLRQHVHRRRRLAVPAVPADAARPDPAQQPALRRQPARPSPPTTSTRSSCTARRTGTSRFIRRFMLFFGPISSLFDFLTFGVMLWVFHAGADAVPLRLVRRVAGHPDPGHLRDPHPAGPVLAQPPEPAADSRARSASWRSARCCRHAAGPALGFTAAARRLLRRPGRHGRRLPRPDRGRQAALLPRPRRTAPRRPSTARAQRRDPSPRDTVEHPRSSAPPNPRGTPLVVLKTCPAGPPAAEHPSGLSLRTNPPRNARTVPTAAWTRPPYRHHTDQMEMTCGVTY